MKRKLFDKTLSFEINVIGHKDRGESIVFFLKANDKTIYAELANLDNILDHVSEYG